MTNYQAEKEAQLEKDFALYISMAEKAAVNRDKRTASNMTLKAANLREYGKIEDYTKSIDNCRTYCAEYVGEFEWVF